MSNKRNTGEFLKRCYGIRLEMPISMLDLFVNPISYVIAQFMLETKAEKRERIRDWARRHDIKYKEARQKLERAIMSREGSPGVLTHSRRTLNRQKHLVLKNMVHAGNKFRGEVKSKGSYPLNGGYYSFHLKESEVERDTNIGYPGSTSNVPDQFYNEEKGKDLTVVGIHLAIPEIALYNDNLFGWGQDSNVTNLSPKERETSQPNPELPFTFTRFSQNYEKSLSSLDFHQFITDLIMEYYIGKKTQYEISVKLANETRLFSAELLKALRDPKDRARFQVLRQMERGAIPETYSEDIHYASSRALMERIEKVIVDSKKGYHFSGYMREFPAHDPDRIKESFETVSKRFEPTGKGPVYSLCMVERVPIIVKRNLDHKVEDLLSSDGELRDTHPLRRIGIQYKTIDDVTRMDATTEVILPDEGLMKRRVAIAQNLRERYDKIRAGTFTL